MTGEIADGMDERLQAIADSYDRGIDLGRDGIDAYDVLPEYVTARADFELFKNMRDGEGLSDSGRHEIRAFLSPEPGMEFVDLGCCLNLMFNGYADWPSTYHGVDISPKTIDLLREHALRNGIRVGSLARCSMHETPHPDSFFDIGACIGSIEYFRRPFVEKTLREIRRIMKPSGKFVLDIPDVGSPEFAVTAMVEEALGRPDAFDMTVAEFEGLLFPHFAVHRRDKVGPMLQYFISKAS